MAFTFRAKLLASHVGLVIAVVLLVVIQIERSLAADLSRQLDDRLEEQARGAAQWGGGSEGRRHPDKIAARLAGVVAADVTIFGTKGELLGSAAPHGASSARDETAGPEVQDALAGRVGHASRVPPSGGEEMRFVAVPTAEPGREGWVVRLGLPLSDVSGPLRAMRARLVFGAVLGTLAALGLGLLASRVAARPLRAMTAASTRLAAGDFRIEVASRAPDDFGELSRSLASLASQLETRIGELRAERDRLSAILAGMAEGVLVLDARRAVVTANPAAATILGHAGGPASLEGEPLAEVVRDDRMRAFIDGAEGGETETEIETPDERAVALYVRPLAAPAPGIVVVLRDMTPVRRALTMRRDFMADASHELRTPVTAIQGYAETLLRGTADPATSKQFLEVIHRHAMRLGSLVDEVLRLTELEDRPPDQVRRERVDVAGVAEAVAETVRARAASEGITVTLDVPRGLEVLADPLELEQVLLNLADNAVKYGKRGGAVRIEGARDDGGVELRVVDDGPGIEARHLPRLFERFYRVDPSRSRDRGGTGLGLAIVKQLVDSMGGAVDVTSEVGRGTTFRVRLPVTA